jgi:large subunit ribosomal protein L29
MKLSELKNQTVAVLNKELAALREKSRDLRFSVSAKQLKNIREIREVKKNIARVLTLINVKQKSGEKVIKEVANNDK